jgi:hypothetical protein
MKVVANSPRGVNVRGTPELKDNANVIASMNNATLFEAERVGDWWKIEAYVHSSVAREATQAIPYVSQLGNDAKYGNDCGAACVAMIARAFGNAITVNQVIEAYQANPSWFEFGEWSIGNYTSFGQASNYLKTLGITANSTRLEHESLPPRGAMCQIVYSALSPFNAADQQFYKQFNPLHLVVFLEGNDNSVIVHDPLWWGESGNRKRWSRAEWNAAFTGACLVVEGLE